MMSRKGMVSILLITIITISIFIGNNPFDKKSIPMTFDLAKDSQHIAWIGSSDIVVYNYVTNEEIASTSTMLSYAKDIAWSPDSTKIAVTGFIGPDENPARIEIYDTVKLKLIFSQEYYFEEHYTVTGQNPYLRWSADGNYLFGEMLHSQIDFSENGFTGEAYEKHILWDTNTWDIIWEYKVPIRNGHSHTIISDSTEKIFYRTGDGNGSISISMTDPLTSINTEFNLFDKNNFEFYVSDILWGNDTTIIIMAFENKNYYTSNLFYSFNFISDELVLLYNTTDIRVPIMNFYGTMVMNLNSDQFNPIHSLIAQQVVNKIEHPFQDLYGKICLDSEASCSISAFHQWSTFSNIIAYSNYYQEFDSYELVIFDPENSKILGSIPEL